MANESNPSILLLRREEMLLTPTKADQLQLRISTGAARAGELDFATPYAQAAYLDITIETPSSHSPAQPGDLASLCFLATFIILGMYLLYVSFPFIQGL